MSRQGTTNRTVNVSGILLAVGMALLLAFVCVNAAIQTRRVSNVMQGLPELVLVQRWEYRDASKDNKSTDKSSAKLRDAFRIYVIDEDILRLRSKHAVRGKCTIKSLNLQRDYVSYNFKPTSKSAKWSLFIRTPASITDSIAGSWTYCADRGDSKHSIWAELNDDGTGRWGYGDFDPTKAEEEELAENAQSCTWTITTTESETIVRLDSDTGYLLATVSDSVSSN